MMLDDYVLRAYQRLQASIIAGQPITVLGKPVIVTFVWPDGYPDGMDADSVRAFGREILDRIEADTPKP